MNPFKTLFDLSTFVHKKNNRDSHQDSCQLFGILAQNEAVKLDALVYAEDRNAFARIKNVSSRSKMIEQMTYFFHDVFKHEKFYLTTVLEKLKLRQFFMRKKNQYHLYLMDEIFNEVIWRNWLSRYLNPVYQKFTSVCSYYFTDMTTNTISTICTDTYDFVIFPKVSAVELTGKAIKIVKFPFPILLSSVNSLSNSLSVHFLKDIKRISEDSYFVCDSQPARDKLIEFVPALENKSCVIPNAVSYDDVVIHDRAKLNHVVMLRSSHRNKVDDHTDLSKYILTVMTHDTMSDFYLLVSAWEKLNSRDGHQIKLIIVLSGLDIEDMNVSTIADYIDKGDLIILNSVTETELSCLYVYAKLYLTSFSVASSYRHLLLAMRYSTPIVATDIPLYRWLFADSALYFDPYSEDRCVDSISQLLCGEDIGALRSKLIINGLQRVSIFSIENITNQWLNLFEKLKVDHSGLR